MIDSVAGPAADQVAISQLWRRVAPAILCAAGCLMPSSAVGEGTGNAVALRLDWPSQLQARVHYRRTKSEAGGGSLSATWTLEARRRIDGTRIATRSTVWKPPIDPDIARAVERVVYLLAPDGKSVRLEGLETIRALVRARELSAPPAALEAADAAMAAEATELWSLLVGFWAGRKLELGVVYDEAALSYTPSARDTPIEQAVALSFTRRVPCVAGEKQRRCVELIYEAQATEASIADATKAALRRRGVVPTDEDLAGLVSATKAVLVTDPETLLPRRLELTKRLVTLAVDGSRRLAKREALDRTEYRYEYRARMAPTVGD